MVNPSQLPVNLSPGAQFSFSCKATLFSCLSKAVCCALRQYLIRVANYSLDQSPLSRQKTAIFTRKIGFPKNPRHAQPSHPRRSSACNIHIFIILRSTPRPTACGPLVPPEQLRLHGIPFRAALFEWRNYHPKCRRSTPSSAPQLLPRGLRGFVISNSALTEKLISQCTKQPFYQSSLVDCCKEILENFSFDCVFLAHASSPEEALSILALDGKEEVMETCLYRLGVEERNALSKLPLKAYLDITGKPVFNKSGSLRIQKPNSGVFMVVSRPKKSYLKQTPTEPSR